MSLISFSEDSCGLAMWKECQLIESHTVYCVQHLKGRATNIDQGLDRHHKKI